MKSKHSTGVESGEPTNDINTNTILSKQSLFEITFVFQWKTEFSYWFRGSFGMFHLHNCYNLLKPLAGENFNKLVIMISNWESCIPIVDMIKYLAERLVTYQVWLFQNYILLPSTNWKGYSRLFICFEMCCFDKGEVCYSSCMRGLQSPKSNKDFQVKK